LKKAEAIMAKTDSVDKYIASQPKAVHALPKK